MKYLCIVTAFFAACFIETKSQTCLQTKPKDNFNFAQFKGLWFLHEVFKTDEIYTPGSCPTFVYYQNPEDGTVYLMNLRNVTNQLQTRYMKTKSIEPGSYLITHPEYTMKLTVIDTDYKNWAVLYGCTSTGVVKAAVYTGNENDLNTADRNKVNSLLNKLEIDPQSMKKMDLSTCPFHQL